MYSDSLEMARVRQEPVVMGSLPGYTELANTDTGFYDPRW